MIARKETSTEYLRYDFRPEEIQEMGKSLAEQYNKQSQIEEEFDAVKAQFKERTTRVDQEIGRLSRLITTQFEMRNVECRMFWHAPTTGFCTVVRTDTGEVIKERVMTMEERQDLLPFPDNHKRHIPRPEKVRGALAEIGEDIALDVVAKWSDVDLCLALEWAEALNNEHVGDAEGQQMPVPQRPDVLSDYKRADSAAGE